MSRVSLDHVKRYGVAVLAMVLATAARLFLDPLVSYRFPFATLFFAILVVAWHGGFGPALVATTLGALASILFLLPPRGEYQIAGTEPPGVLIYLIVGLGIAALGGGMRRAQRTAQERQTVSQIEIDTRREVEGELRLSETRFRSLVDATASIVWVCNPAGELIGEQTSWAAVTGQSEDEYLRSGWLNALHPEDRAATRDLWEEAVANSAPYVASYRLWHAASESYRHVQAKGMPVFHEDGVVREWIGMCIDVEDQYRAEAALHEADRRKDEFLATLAHELRNPLAPIRNAALMLRAKQAPQQDIEYAANVIDRQAEQMSRLLDDLLDVARIARGRIMLRKERIDLSETVQSAIEQSRPLIEKAGLSIDVELPTEQIILEADRTRMIQVFANLLNNSAKYTERTGHIELTARREGEQAVVTVRDTGIGIAPEQLARIFEMFSQVTPAIDRQQGGLGVGLALVRGMVELHDGTVEATSEGPGKGSEFVVRLPIAAQQTAAASESQPTTNGEKTTELRVLVVDDNQDAARTMATLLRLTGHDVRAVFDGEGALEAVDSWQPEVVLLDIGLPGMNGYEVCRHIRSRPGGKQIVVAALTGWGQDEDRRRSVEAGFDHHFTKPVKIDDLLATLTQHATPRKPATGA